MSMQAQLQDKLAQHFHPHYLAVVNESDQHHVPPGSESHFKVTLVSDQFNDKRLIERHRQVNQVLRAEFADIHALALHLYTVNEWRQKQATAPDSPKCRGGAKREANTDTSA